MSIKTWTAATVVWAVGSTAVWGQTQLDLRTQGKNVDFSGAASTRPIKSGTAIPAVCQVGELYFRTNATAGQNLYACVAANTWTLQSGSGAGITLQSGNTGGLLITSSGSTVQVDADTSFLMANGGDNAPSGSMAPIAGIWDLTNVNALRMRNGSSDPAACQVGELFVNTSGIPVLKLCVSADSWSGLGGGAGGVTQKTYLLYSSAGGAGVCTAGVSTLGTYTIAAGVLEAGDVVDVRVVWKKTGTTGSLQGKVWFGGVSGTQLNGTLTISAGDSFATTEASVFVSGANVQRILGRNWRENTAMSGWTTNGAALNTGSSIPVDVTAEGCTGGDTISIDWIEIVLKKHAS